MSGRPTGKSTHAFTLVELLVTIGIVVAVLGLALEVMVQSSRSAGAITRYQAGVQYCQLALDDAVRTIRCAVAPEGITGVNNPALLKPRLTKNELILVASIPGPKPSFSRVSFGNEVKGKDTIGIVRRRLALTDSATTASETVDNFAASRPDRLHPSIRFAYAATPADGKPDYKAEWTGPGLPALIQITVEARLSGTPGRLSDIVLQTAVIPGLVPPGPSIPGINPPPVITSPTPLPTVRPLPTSTPAPSPTPLPTITPLPTPVAGVQSSAPQAAHENSKPARVIQAAPVRRIVGSGNLVTSGRSGQ